MKVRSAAGGAAITVMVAAWFVVGIFGVPLLTAVGLWLLGVPMDWSSGRTYLGLIALSAAMIWAGSDGSKK